VGERLIVGGNSSSFGYLRQFNTVTGDELTEWGTIHEGGWIVDLESDGEFLYRLQFYGVLASVLAEPSTVLSLGPSFSPIGPNICLTMAQTESVRFIGGLLFDVNDVAVSHLVGIDRMTGEVVPWVPLIPGNMVLDLLISDGILYIAGEFYSVGGVQRLGLAAIDVTNGELLPFNPGVLVIPRVMSLNGARLYVGGSFGALGGFSTYLLGALSLPSGEAVPWDPQMSQTGAVLALHSAGDRLFAAGTFTSVEGINKPGFAVWSLDGVGMEERAAPMVGLHPNPTTGVVHLSGNASQVRKVVLHDLLGAQVASVPYTNSFDVSHLAEGVYLATLLGVNDQVVGRSKLMLEK
jgi:hypothetical protein